MDAKMREHLTQVRLRHRNRIASLIHKHNETEKAVSDHHNHIRTVWSVSSEYNALQFRTKAFFNDVHLFH